MPDRRCQRMHDPQAWISTVCSETEAEARDAVRISIGELGIHVGAPSRLAGSGAGRGAAPATHARAPRDRRLRSRSRRHLGDARTRAQRNEASPDGVLPVVGPHHRRPLPWRARDPLLDGSHRGREAAHHRSANQPPRTARSPHRIFGPQGDSTRRAGPRSLRRTKGGRWYPRSRVIGRAAWLARGGDRGEAIAGRRSRWRDRTVKA